MPTDRAPAPSVDVLLPAHNAEATLAAALDSIRRQTLLALRCLVVDDGSTDRTAEIALRFCREDPRFRLLRTDRCGIVAALNSGLDWLAQTPPAAPLIARMDADDLALPQRLERQVEYLGAHAELDLLGCGCELFNSDASPVGSGMKRYVDWANSLLTPEDHLRERFVESPLVHPSVVARASLFEGGYDATVPWTEDYDLWLRRLEGGARFAKLDTVLMRIRDDRQRTSRQDPRCTQDALRACKIAHLLGGALRGRERVLLWGAGRVGKKWLRQLPEAGIEVPAVVDLHPRKIGRIIHGARVVAPADLPAELVAADTICLVAVGADGSRDDNRRRLSALGLVEGRDAIFVA